jgi:formylglycine-generating enzyme required for sulfatase activity/energy-coupling factor transporter ATP-binding protein EcfA2
MENTMDPFLISLIWAIGVGVSSVAGKLADKGFDAAAKPVIDKLAGLVKGGLEQAERETKLADAIRAAIEDSTKDLSGFRKPERSESEFAKYAREIGLERLTLKGNRALLDRVIALSLISSSRDDSALVSDALLHELNLEPNQRAPFARFLYHLRVRLNEISEFQPMIRLAHETNMENAARIMIVEIARVGYIVSEIAQTVMTTPEGIKALRVQIVDDTLQFEPYLRRAAEDCNQLQYLGNIDKQYADVTRERALTLMDVYTRLETTGLVERKEDQGPKEFQQEIRASFLEREKPRRLTVIQTVSETDAPRIVLLGDAGSGKSTFVNHLAYCLAQARLGDKLDWLEKLQGWTFGALLPVRVVLRELMAQTDLTREPTADVLWDFIRADLDARGHLQYFDGLQRHLQQRGGILLLDGLDEVTDADKQREFIKAVIEDFERGGLCRVIVTCRPYAYERAEWKLRGFVERSVAPFSPEQIQEFVSAWYHAQRVVFGMSMDDARVKANKLSTAIQNEGYLAELATSPLLLTLMATVHTSKGELPEDRALLYQEVVDLLLDRWQQTKTVGGKAERGLQDYLGVTRTELQETLARVAFQAHQTQGEARPKTRARTDEQAPRAADIQGALLRRALGELVGKDEIKIAEAIRYIRTRAGLLLEKDQERDLFAFPHRQFQEFLAAAYLCQSPDFVLDIQELVDKDALWWRQVFLLAVGRKRPSDYGTSIELLNKMLPALPRHGKRGAPKNAARALLCATGAGEIRLGVKAQSDERYRNAPKKFQQWLVAIIGQELLTLPERAEAGRLLSKLGDARAEVNCEIPTTLPVAAGEFVMGGDGPYDGKPIHPVTLSDFRIGKYPVTNAQFRLFVQGDGYTNRAYWKYDKGWKWKNRKEITKPEYWDDPQWNLENHPVVGVSWYEADAYCEWLNKRLENGDWRFRLPTEAEWEKAASWDDSKKSKRVYAWGDEYEGQKGNVDASGIGRTSAVGLFGNYPSPCGAMDMTGNVWEWCADWYNSEYYQKSPRENPQGPPSGNLRSLRGCAFSDESVFARCASRNWNLPDFRLYAFGFRVVSFPVLTLNSRGGKTFRVSKNPKGLAREDFSGIGNGAHW